MTRPPVIRLLRCGPAARAVLVAALLLIAVLLPAPSAAARDARWSWPLPPPHPVARPFDAPDGPYGPGHRGIDIGTGAGAVPVRVVEDGVVRFAGSVAGRPVLSIRHHDGLLSTYEPVTATVAAGQRVRAGQVIGALDPEVADRSHCAPQLCLHLGARRGEQYQDPELLLGVRGPSVLLPIAGGQGSGSGTGTGGGEQLPRVRALPVPGAGLARVPRRDRPVPPLIRGPRTGPVPLLQ